MNIDNNIIGVNLLGSPGNSGQDSHPTTIKVIDSSIMTNDFKMLPPINPESFVVPDKPLPERSAREKNPNISHPERLVKFDTACVNKEPDNTLSPLLTRRDESMLDGRIGRQRLAAEITLDNEIESSIKKAVQNKNHNELDRLLQQHNAHSDTILAGNNLTLALETAILSEESMAISLINAGVGIKYDNEKCSKSGLATALFLKKHTVAEALLQKGASVEGCSYDLRKPLLITIDRGDLKGFELLLKYEPVLTFDFLRTALELLVDESSSMKVTDPTKRAAILTMAKVLINAGVNIKVNVKGNEVTDAPILTGNRAYGNGGIDLTKDEGSLSALCKAIDLKDFDLVKLLLDKGYDVDAGKKCRVNAGNPLHIATSYSNYDLVNLLLVYGADVNAFYSDPEAKGEPVTPLVAAFRHNPRNIDIINLLLSHGAIVHKFLSKAYPKMLEKNLIKDPKSPPNPLTLYSTCLQKTIALCGDVSEESKPNKYHILKKIKNFNLKDNLIKVKSNVESLLIPYTLKSDLLAGVGRVSRCDIYNIQVEKS